MMDAPPVHYAKTSDGYDIAYAVRGQSDRALVAVPMPHNHLQLLWQQAGDTQQMLAGLAERYRLVQYDARGQGMSMRGLPDEIPVEAFLLDLEAVVDRLSLERFILYGWGNALGHVAIRYALAHPERVQGLVLQCTAVETSAWPGALFVDLPAQNWDLYLRQVARAWAQRAAELAGRDPQEVDHEHTYEFLQACATQHDYLATLRAFRQSDISDLLSGMKTPTLLLHPRDFTPLPVAEAVRMASSIANSRLVLLDGSTRHGNIDQLLRAVDDFVSSLGSEGDRAAKPVTHALSDREIEVLRLLAAGKSNQQIADELVISRNTVRRHVSNVFDKTGVANRTEASVYARDHGLV